MDNGQKTRCGWRPSKAEIAKALSRYRNSPKPWVKARFRILMRLQRFPQASDKELARMSEAREPALQTLLRGWQQEGIEAIGRFGRPPDLNEADLAGLKRYLSTKPRTVRDAQRYISRCVLHADSDTAISLSRAAFYCRKAGQRRKKRRHSVPSEYIEALRPRRPAIANALVRIVTDGLPVRTAAREIHGYDSTLRYHLKRGSRKSGAVQPPGAFLPGFFEWCDGQKHVGIAAVREYLRQIGIKHKSDRSLHRYIQRWKDDRGITRRTWSCGGSIRR